MQIEINLKTMSDSALVFLGEAFLVECNVEAQAFPIAEQRCMMFKAVSNEMVMRGINPSALNERFVRSVANEMLKSPKAYSRRRFRRVES